MKAVIVECSNGAAVALCDDGTFRKLKNKGYFIGQELLIKHKPSANRMVQKLSICASLALVLLSFAGIGSHSLKEPYSYVSLDINPSIEYALNRYDKVISVSGINHEGQQVVSSIESDIKNQNITTALGVTIGQLEKDHYIIQEAYNHVIVSVYSANNTKAQSIASRVNTFSAEKSSICAIDTIPVSKEVKDDADSLGITPGKLALIHAVAETTSDSNFNVSEWTNKTVSELETTIQQASSQVPDSGSGPEPVSVVNSEYLSSVLDDNTANKSDDASASATGADKEAGSASTDTQTNTDDTTAGSVTDGTASDSKPNQTDSPVTSADGSTDSTSKPGTNASSTNNSSSAVENNNSTTVNQDTSADVSDKNTSPDKGSSGTSPSKNPESQGTGSSPSKGDSSSDSASKPDNDDTLTEDSAIKKDPYPSTVTDTPQDVPEEGTAGDSSSVSDSTAVSGSTAGEESVSDQTSAESVPNAGSPEEGASQSSGSAEN